MKHLKTFENTIKNYFKKYIVVRFLTINQDIHTYVLRTRPTKSSRDLSYDKYIFFENNKLKKENFEDVYHDYEDNKNLSIIYQTNSEKEAIDELMKQLALNKYNL